MQEDIFAILLQNGDYVSGAQICKQLGITRSAVWKHIQALRKNGCDIRSVTNKGYLLTDCPHRAVHQAVQAQGGRFVYLDSVDSTNLYAKQWAKQGAPHASCVMAGTQTHGRGRRGRAWSSQPGENVYMSVILRPDMPPAYAPRLTILAALALAQTIEHTAGVQARIKWPNDVLVDGLKLCGILLELSAQLEAVDYIVLGMGINANQTQFDPSLADIATSVALLSGKQVDLCQLAAHALQSLFALLCQYQAQGFAPLLTQYCQKSCTLGQEVTITGAQAMQGTVAGFDELGMLLLQTADGVCKIAAGDVSLRPTPLGT